jgi:hypothetical protein
MSLAFHLIQIVYWLSLSTWFGGVLFVAVSAPIIFRTVRESNPILPSVLSVNLEGQHGTLLAGTIVANLLTGLRRVELACAAGMLVAIVVQWFLPLSEDVIPRVLRSALFVTAVGIVVYQWRAVWPRIDRHRREYIDHADDPDVANPAKDEFDRYHRESVTLLTIELALLLGIVLFSAGIRLRPLLMA